MFCAERGGANLQLNYTTAHNYYFITSFHINLYAIANESHRIDTDPTLFRRDSIDTDESTV